MNQIILAACGVFLMYVAVEPTPFEDGGWRIGLGIALLGLLFTKFNIAKQAGSALIAIGLAAAILSFIGVVYSEQIRDITFYLGLIVFAVALIVFAFWFAGAYRRLQRLRRNRQHQDSNERAA